MVLMEVESRHQGGQVEDVGVRMALREMSESG